MTPLTFKKYVKHCSKDVRLPVQLQRAMAAEAEAAREARAKVSHLFQGSTGHHFRSGSPENFQNPDRPETGRFPSRTPDF